MSNQKEAELTRCYYRSTGPQLTVDVLVVEYVVDGEIYRHELPNSGWGYNIPALQFIAFAGSKPSNFEGSELEFNNEIVPVVWNSEQGGYRLTNQPLKIGAIALENADWFDPKGTVWNSGEVQAFGGMSVEPNTGNKSTVEGEEK